MPQNKYLDILEQAWQDHLKERLPDAPTVISLFAGCGGSSLGYSMAGFRELLAVEWDDNAIETFKLNFPDIPVYHGDIAKLSVDECLKLTGLQPGQLDILDGSPPCQGFSTAGKRMMEDPRNSLFKEYVRLLQGLKPKVFVMENVSGMIKGKMKIIFAEILRELKASGYKVSARVLNAMYFNVPQSRQRMIFIGVREDLGIEPSHPRAEGRPIAVRQVIPECAATRSQHINPWIDGDRPAATICKMSAGYEISRVNPRPLQIRDRLQWDEIAPTIVKTANSIKAKGNVHPEEDRFLSIPEIRLIASYPNEFGFIGKYQEQWARIGNSVPPLFMRSIANHIRHEILDRVDMTGGTPELLDTQT